MDGRFWAPGIASLGFILATVSRCVCAPRLSLFLARVLLQVGGKNRQDVIPPLTVQTAVNLVKDAFITAGGCGLTRS